MADNKSYPDLHHIKEAICIDTNRVYDSCADKDCLEDLRVYFTSSAQCVIDRATNVRCRGSEVLNAFLRKACKTFNDGWWT